MAQSKSPFISVMGWNVQGDLAGITYYTSKRNGLVAFPKAPPLVPPSPLQTVMRNRFRLIATAWRSLPKAKREAWMRLATASRLWCHGYNLFVFWIQKKDDAPIRTMERRTGIKVLDP